MRCRITQRRKICGLNYGTFIHSLRCLHGVEQGGGRREEQGGRGESAIILDIISILFKSIYNYKRKLA